MGLTKRKPKSILKLSRKSDTVNFEKELPEVEPVHINARWIKQTIFHGTYFEDIIVCSKCHYRNEIQMSECPHCGAKMVCDNLFDGIKNAYVGDENGNAVKVWNKEEGWINKELFDRREEIVKSIMDCSKINLEYENDYL